MLQTETSKTRKKMFDDYKAKHIVNRELEWLIEEGKIRESVYFKGETGDRYTIYIATKRNSKIIDFHTVSNSYSHGTELGYHIATLRGYVLEMRQKSNSWPSSYMATRFAVYGLGYSFKQLMRQGVMSNKHPWKIRYCRNAFLLDLMIKLFQKEEL